MRLSTVLVRVSLALCLCLGVVAQMQSDDRHPPELPPFTPPANWQGKAVLAEVFTGSECPPCVSAAMAFEGLKDAYPPKYLAILKYHLPIPRYDPMINPTTEKRREYYDVRSTPTAILDGVKSVPVGGSKSDSYEAYKNLQKEIDQSIDAPAELTIKAKATFKKDIVTVKCQFSKAIEGADYHVALVEKEVAYKGYNGVAHHLMVVRDMKTLQPSFTAEVTFDIADSANKTDAYITKWSEEAPPRRLQDVDISIRRNVIDSYNLKAVVFVQDTATKQVFNVTTVDVKPKFNWYRWTAKGLIILFIIYMVFLSIRKKDEKPQAS